MVLEMIKYLEQIWLPSLESALSHSEKEIYGKLYFIT